MSHRGVEMALGRLATDAAMRRQFQEAPLAALKALVTLGIELSGVELAALASLDPVAVARFASALDPRLQKAVLVAVDEGGASQGGDRKAEKFEA
jgi:hypothetical protein